MTSRRDEDATGSAPSTALLTDRYELTMIDAALRDGTASRTCVFELFGRRLPGARRFGVVAGTGRLLQQLRDFRFGDDELRFLRDHRIVSPETLAFLEGYRFNGTIRGYREGELYFPGSPILTVEGTFAEAVVLETLVLSVLNYDSAVASAAARMGSGALGRPLPAKGGGRTHEESAIAAARAAYIAGFAATSNLAAGRRWGIPTMGTAAHSFTMLHDSEEDAFRAQVAALGSQTTLLVDTYDIEHGVALAVAAAGPELGAVRIDSGDLPSVVARVRAQLDALGAHGTTITVTGDLDEYTIANLARGPVDSYGVGTSVVTGSGHPAARLVYKMVARQGNDGEWVPVAKASQQKASIAGRKNAARVIGAARTAREELVYIGDGPGGADELEPGDQLRPLMVPLMSAGTAAPDALGVAGTRAAREHCAVALAELPADAFRLGRGEPVIPTHFR